MGSCANIYVGRGGEIDLDNGRYLYIYVCVTSNLIYKIKLIQHIDVLFLTYIHTHTH